MGLFETDEAAFARVVPAVRPDVVVVTNLFRDQLDRYGEVDTVATIWRSALAALGAGGAGRRAPLTLALNADDPTVAALSPPGVGATLTYGIGDARWGHPGLEHAADAKVCPACGARLEYPVCFYGHLGHYRCAQRPRPARPGRVRHPPGATRLRGHRPDPDHSRWRDRLPAPPAWPLQRLQRPRRRHRGPRAGPLPDRHPGGSGHLQRGVRAPGAGHRGAGTPSPSSWPRTRWG